MSKARFTGYIASIAMAMAFVLFLALAASTTNAQAVEAASSSGSAAAATATDSQPEVVAPKKASFHVPDKGSTKMKLTLKVKGSADGFQVKYRDVSSKPYGKMKTKNVKSTSVTLKKLEVNHTYKIKVRAYNLTANGKKKFGAYCKAKTVFNGVKPLVDSKIKKMWYQPFIHGTKKAGQQRYIMLHDTESYSGPSGVVEGWKSDNGGTVAAHFVVGRDGTVVQTAKMKRILHHAGFGGPGNFDKKFGVGKNNGKGTGDDLVGQVWWSGYSSYGMNSYSIGIEMCHVGGQNYTAKQLKAVDRLIALIDQEYGGYGGKIIDHKTWRPSNSDCDANFQKYLKNYQKYRKHAK